MSVTLEWYRKRTNTIARELNFRKCNVIENCIILTKVRQTAEPRLVRFKCRIRFQVSGRFRM